MVVVLAAASAAGDQVFHLTAHGDAARGVNRTAAVPIGHCLQCHPGVRESPAQPVSLFTTNDNSLCFTCHASAGVATVYAGQAAYAGGAHATSSAARWPGPTPAARPAGDAGKCLNCHTAHGARDGQGLVPNLEYYREEALCLACHDASGPARTNLLAETQKAGRHPTTTVSAVHQPREGSTPGNFGLGKRHAECTDCHNPHALKSTDKLAGTSRIQVTNGAAGSTPGYTFVPGTNTGPVKEYELCFKCHSSWTTQPAGQTDLAKVLNPNNASFHPVEAAGKNTTSAMTASLAGGTGLPHLTTSSVLTCADCHNSEAIPTTVSLVALYDGGVPSGPHGSNAGASNPALSNVLLRAAYRVTLKASGAAYAASDFTLCFICHAQGPFNTTNKDARADTNFSLHGFHVRGMSGAGNALCRECHSNTHGPRGAAWAANAGYARGVNFSPNVTGSSTSAPTWTPGSCNLRCHGQDHNPETY